MIHNVDSISQIHQALNLGKPKNPLITIIDMANFEVKDFWVEAKFISQLYTITLKDESCGLEYGRNTYDFQEGVMSFIAPNQVYGITTKPKQQVEGWMLVFHPELIRGTNIGRKIENLNLFSYHVHEALHLSEQEQKTVTDCITMIDEEIKERIDKHSKDVIVSGLDFFFSYCTRFYERQFNTRAAANSDILIKVENLLKNYYQTHKTDFQGLPTVSYLADKVNLSPGYLSDLLKNETGKTAKEHINLYLIDKAKNTLLNTTLTVSEIAYDLGFEYPQHFSKLFKAKTGLTPKTYRTKSN